MKYLNDVFVWCDMFVITVFGFRLYTVYPSPPIEVFTRGVNLPSNHGTCTLHTTAESWIFCCIMFTKVSTTKLTTIWYMYRIALQYTFPNYVVTYPNPIAVPNFYKN